MISVSTTKSGSNWLDRLRSSRGFPTGEEPDLGLFLASSSSGSAPVCSESIHSESTQCQTDIHKRNKKSVGIRQNDDEQWFDEVSNVLCELFNTESSRSFPKKKSSRKQPNPRFCGASSNGNELCSSDDLRREKSDNRLASSGDNSLNEIRRENNNNGHVSSFFHGEEEKDEDVDLKSYSRSEVMVIDTSIPEWKFDGWVFRKNDEWKIKAKKCGSKGFGGKKRKLLAIVNEKLDKDQKNKKNDEEKFLLLNKGQAQNEKEEQPIKKTADFIGKVPQKRFPCPRPPEKFGNDGSSVILLKSIPSSNNSNGTTKLSKSSRKKTPKRLKIG